jgi:diacylglycerol O-acyltransferase
MADTQVNECLSCVDAFFLYVEQPGAPVNVASISIFEGLITLAECTQYIDSKLPLIPRFLQRVVPPPFGIGPPTWQTDPNFDVKNHVFEVSLKHGTEPELKKCVSQILSTNLDRNRPLWDITLIHGIRDQRTGIVVRTHHCLVDGIAGVGMLKMLLDVSPTSVRQPRRRRPSYKNQPPDPATVLLDGLISSCFTAAQALLTTHSELLQMAQHLSAPSLPMQDKAATSANGVKPTGGIAQFGQLVSALSELAQFTQRLPFNVLCHGPQRFEWTEIPMADITEVKQACAGTVNDVVLTTLTATLRRYAEMHRHPVNGRMLRLVVPVNLRGVSEANDTGNHITFLPVDIPFGTRAPKKLIASVQERVASSHTAHAGELVGLISTMLGAVPSPLQALIGNILSQLPISVCNSICTNVHGPRVPLYLLGHKMIASYPYVPIGGEMGMNCAVLSYNETLFVGFTGDAKAIPDLDQLPVFFRESFAELKSSLNIRPPKRRAPKQRLKVMPEPIANATEQSGPEPVEMQAEAASAGVT